MKPSIFISYSRREAPFVNDLTDRLEDGGYSVWLDYRSMVPGKPWAEQIEEGIRQSEIILLVVSDAAMGSKWVEKEWRSMLRYGKRVILILFEANELPPELEGFEWVDFRGNHRKALAELMSQLDQPQAEETPPPQKAFASPASSGPPSLSAWAWRSSACPPSGPALRPSICFPCRIAS